MRLLRDDGPFGGHLRLLRYWLEKRPELATAVVRILIGKPCADSEFHWLASDGIVDGIRDDEPRQRYLLYEFYLKQNLPQAGNEARE